MNNSSLSSVLLPAVFVSSAVFSTLTIPFALIRSEPVVVELPFYSGEIQPIFDGQHKQVAIPYIGFAIVVSVGAGMATVEANRRLREIRKSALQKKLSSSLQLLSGDKEAQPEAVKLPEYLPKADAVAATATFKPMDFSTNGEVLSLQSLTESNTAKATTLIGVETPEPVIAPQGTTFATSTVLEKLDLPQVSDENDSEHCSWDLGFNKILESPQEYQTCRIKVPHLARRLFAIEVNGEYYSFFRALETKEKVLEVMTKLGSSVEKTAITKTPKSYVIWVWEPKGKFFRC
ncbi:MAG: TetR family transcriptional regulator [Symploca sp. SIO2G7]|nr:TetR family transcriptional regulator [Symploca sp. SIO2G7]